MGSADCQGSMEAFGVDLGEATQELGKETDGITDSATRVILNLRAIMEKNDGQMGLPRQVVERRRSREEQQQPVDGSFQTPYREVTRLQEELAKTRAELEQAREGDQVALQRKTQEVATLEAELRARASELEEKAKRQEEISALQSHILEVEMQRCQEELQLSRSKVEALEKELKQEGTLIKDTRAETRERTSPSRKASKAEAQQGWFACCSVQHAPKGRA
ncbi:unnamed protein product [Effrenium voratum]|nr:unnamed protein product [Effrenium voratum]